jgi:hypothetical protein
MRSSALLLRFHSRCILIPGRARPEVKARDAEARFALDWKRRDNQILARC